MSLNETEGETKPFSEYIFFKFAKMFEGFGRFVSLEILPYRTFHGSSFHFFLCRRITYEFVSKFSAALANCFLCILRQKNILRNDKKDRTGIDFVGILGFRGPKFHRNSVPFLSENPKKAEFKQSQ